MLTFVIADGGELVIVGSLDLDGVVVEANARTVVVE